jgi:hypothetical protein
VAAITGSGQQKDWTLKVQVKPPALVVKAMSKVRLSPGTTTLPVRIERGDYEGPCELVLLEKGREVIAEVKQDKEQTFVELQVPRGTSPGKGRMLLQARVAGLAAGQPFQVEYEVVRIDRVLGEKGGHTLPVLSVAFGPDGKTLALGGGTKTVKLWDVSTAKSTATLAGHIDSVSSLAFSRDGKTLASGSWDKTIMLWDVKTGKSTAILARGFGDIYAVAFSPDGKTLASTGYDQAITLGAVSTGKSTATLTGFTNWVRSLAFSPDGKTLASGSDDRTVRIWDLTALR